MTKQEFSNQQLESMSKYILSTYAFQRALRSSTIINPKYMPLFPSGKCHQNCIEYCKNPLNRGFRIARGFLVCHLLGTKIVLACFHSVLKNKTGIFIDITARNDGNYLWGVIFYAIEGDFDPRDYVHKNYVLDIDGKIIKQYSPGEDEQIYETYIKPVLPP